MTPFTDHGAFEALLLLHRGRAHSSIEAYLLQLVLFFFNGDLESYSLLTDIFGFIEHSHSHSQDVIQEFIFLSFSFIPGVFKWIELHLRSFKEKE